MVCCAAPLAVMSMHEKLFKAGCNGMCLYKLLSEPSCIDCIHHSPGRGYGAEHRHTQDTLKTNYRGAPRCGTQEASARPALWRDPGHSSNARSILFRLTLRRRSSWGLGSGGVRSHPSLACALRPLRLRLSLPSCLYKSN